MTNKLPRWRGFNLLEMFIWEPGGELVSAGGAGDFREADFEWIREWGFDFVRIPMDYRFWTVADPAGGSGGAWRFRVETLERIDRLVELGRQYGVHVSLDFHRAPGYCVNPPAEARSLWTDPAMQGMFCAQWHALALRYKGIPSERLSFDLVNEPPSPGACGLTRKNHEQVVRGAVAAIRGVDPERLIVADGLTYGQEVVKEIIDLGDQQVGQSCRAYGPFGISHYQAPWVNYPWTQAPRWPGADHFGSTWGRAELEAYYAPWAALVQRGVGVHCGEGGCFNKTPHAVFLAWFTEVLEILQGHGIGWALWNFRGPFGVVDSERGDVAYEDFHEHKLDRELLELLRRS